MVDINIVLKIALSKFVSQNIRHLKLANAPNIYLGKKTKPQLPTIIKI